MSEDKTKQQLIEEMFPINKCEGCLYAVEIPYTHHIGCSRIYKDEMQRIISCEKPQIPIIEGEGVYLKLITINPHGWSQGWAQWPWRFDPVWIACRLTLE
jgi:hypothetical protein